MSKQTLTTRIFRLVEREAEAGRTKRGVRLAHLLAALRPAHAEAWINLARAVLAHHRFTASGFDAEIAVLEKGLRNCPGDVALVSELALAHVSVGETDVAIPMLESVRASHPEAPEPLISLADAWRRKREWRSAEQFAELALSRISVREQPDQAARLAGVLVGIPGRFDSAAQLLDTVMKEAPRNASLRIVAAAILESRDPDRSRNIQIEARKLWSGSSERFEFELEVARRMVKAQLEST